MTARAGQPPCGRSRGMILLTVMVVVVMSALIGTTLLYRADAEQAASAVVLDQTRLRALAWSGVQGVMAELQSQRDALLDGGAPELTARTELWTLGGRRGVVRLRTLDDSGQVHVESELSKLDANTADAAMFAILPGWNEELAAAVVQERGTRPFESAADVARVKAVRDLVLADDPTVVRSASPGLGSRRREPTADVLRHITVFSFDPNTIAGVSREGEAVRGSARTHVDVGWTPDSSAALKPQLSAEGLESAQAVLAGAGAADAGAFVRQMRQAQVPVARFGELLDVLTTSDDQYLRGRVDLSNASTEVLACVPGIDQAAAERIVQTRARLEGATKRSIGWLLTEAVLTPDQFQQAAKWVTTRSLVWRVQVEAMIEREDQDSEEVATVAGPFMRWEAIVDLSDQTPRVAYLRDVTYETETKERAKQELSRQKSARGGAEETEPAILEVPTAPDTPTPPPPKPGATSKPTPTVKDARPSSTSADQGTAAPPAKTPPVAKDRRIGRWTSGKSGGS